jgi:hypothetical protein
MEHTRITEEQLIKKYTHDPILFHLAKTPIANKDKCLIKSHPQLFALGFNAGGRPDGLWVSRGSSWIAKAHELQNPKFPVCCYIYEVNFKPDAKILYVKTAEDFQRFDEQFPSYWINLDYFEVDFVDYINGKKIKRARKHTLNLKKLRKRAGESIKETLLNNNIIFENTSSAIEHCKFYNEVKIDIERFKYKDWDAISKDYHGVIFESWDLNDKTAMKYLWFQSLDVASGCIWDVQAIDSITLTYHKIDATTWEHA